MTAAAYTSKRVVFTYVASNAVFTLATSMIWAINTIFLIQRGGLTLFEVMLVNSAFLVAQALSEVPTGVIADTIGRKWSYLASIATISVSTVLYVITPLMHWGLAGFTIGSALLGVGFTFETGAFDAWMVDALDATGWEGPKDRVFARGGQANSAAVIVGSLTGGLLGNVNLVIPYLVRAGLLVVAFVMVVVLVHDWGFQPRPLAWSTFGAESRRILAAGTRYGWQSRVIRPMMFVSLCQGVAGMFVFYSWQPFFLNLLGNQKAVWLLGVVQAAGSAAGFVGAGLGGAIRGRGGRQFSAAGLLGTGALISAAGVLGIAIVGFSHLAPGALPAGIAIAIWIVWSLMFGTLMPIRSGYINEHIASAERATVLSLDSLFGDVGGSVGQPVLGWIATVIGLPVAWAIGAFAFATGGPLYALSGRAAKETEARGRSS